MTVSDYTNGQVYTAALMLTGAAYKAWECYKVQPAACGLYTAAATISAINITKQRTSHNVLSAFTLIAALTCEVWSSIQSTTSNL